MAVVVSSGNSVQSGAHCCNLSSRPCLSGLLSRSRKASWISARRRCARTSVVKMEVSKSQCKQREGSSPSASETNVAKRGLTSPLRRNIAQGGISQVHSRSEVRNQRGMFANLQRTP